MQIVARRQKALRWLYLPQIISKAVLQPGKAADGQMAIGVSWVSATVATQSAIWKAKPDNISLRYAQALVAFKTFILSNLGNAILLFNTAIAHTAIGNDQYVYRHIFSFSQLNKQSCSQSRIVIMGTYY